MDYTVVLLTQRPSSALELLAFALERAARIGAEEAADRVHGQLRLGGHEEANRRGPVRARLAGGGDLRRDLTERGLGGRLHLVVAALEQRDERRRLVDVGSVAF